MSSSGERDFGDGVAGSRRYARTHAFARARECTEVNGAVLHEAHGGPTKFHGANTKRETAFWFALGFSSRSSCDLRVLRVEPLRSPPCPSHPATMNGRTGIMLVARQDDVITEIIIREAITIHR